MEWKESIFDRSSKRSFAVGAKVRFKEEVMSRNVQEAKIFSGRVGTVTGYRLGAEDPIVVFAKEGRRKEVKLYEVRSSEIELVP